MHSSYEPAAITVGADLPVVGLRVRREHSNPADRIRTVDPISRASLAASRREFRDETLAKRHASKDPSALIDHTFDALAQQSVVQPSAATVELVISRVATQVKEFKTQRTLVATTVKTLVDTHPGNQVLLSTPGVGITTTAILLTAEDFSSRPSPVDARWSTEQIVQPNLA